MATTHLKRPRGDDLSQDRGPSKKIRSTRKSQRNFPPEFWDGLSQIPLTRRALRELDRRNMASNRSPSSSRRTKSARSKSAQSTQPTDLSPSTRASSAYDDAFEQHMIDNSIYPEQYEYPDSRPTPEPQNMDQLRLDYSAARASLSPSQFSDGAFREFKRKSKARSEATVMRNVIPVIAGNANIPNEGNLPFTNITSMTGGATVKAVPDFFDGAHPGTIDAAVRDDLSQLIIPTKHADVPVAPNFSLEAKAPSGGVDVVLRQALHNGAIGARAMHALQNYGEEEPVFDGNAYSYSSTYHAGTGALQLYTHHVTAPTAQGERPGYHMTKLGGYFMTDSRDTFVQGATVFRNIRDIAQGHRDMFIQSANTRAQQYEESTSEEYADCEEQVYQQAISTDEYTAFQDFNNTAAPPRVLYSVGEEPSQESTSLGVDTSTSLATSFTPSSNEPTQTGSKRNRAHNSPPSKAQSREKGKAANKRTHQGASRRASKS
ncbi:hypothetical protein DL546_000423 [Coniochaeta pulveracea]|uniref:DUF7924 domain-containing protein n=1 Tax=Coniochaeta pulveracea TaxID=177199 RepID=A0A420XWD6_9PEZI|nr:hypothetical protein DL546_000423 [Coniochaeta pulveracea]